VCVCVCLPCMEHMAGLCRPFPPGVRKWGEIAEISVHFVSAYATLCVCVCVCHHKARLCVQSTNVIKGESPRDTCTMPPIHNWSRMSLTLCVCVCVRVCRYTT